MTILTRDYDQEKVTLKNLLAKEFEIEDLGDLKYFPRMEVSWSTEGICISQRKYILDLLEETSMLGCKPLDIPMDSNVKLGLDQDNSSVDKGYQRLIGKLIYLSHTRSNIRFFVSLVSRFMNNPTKEIMIYTDADWVGSPIDRRSTSGYCSYVWGNPVT